MENPWDALSNDALPRLHEIDRDLSKIAGQKGYLDANCLAYMSGNMGKRDKANKNCVTFSIRTVTFLGDQKNRGELHDGSIQISIPRGENCAEYKVYSKLLPGLTIGQHLIISQSKAPCRGCLNRLQGLARAKRINIVVHYDEAYDVLNTNNGLVFVSATGMVCWQK